MSEFRTEPSLSSKLPSGIPHIVGNEAAERFSFYGMKAGLAIFLANYLGHLGGESMSETQATVYVAAFTAAVYFTPFFGALVSDWFWGKYRTIITLSIVYCLGHLCLAFMGVGGAVQFWLLAGLGLISIGAGGIKPCVSAHVGDQFGPNNQHLLTKIFNLFYLSINLGAAVSNLLIPWLLEWYGPHWAFGIPGILMALATVVFWIGRHRFVHVPASGSAFIRQVFSKEGVGSLAWLVPLFLFVAVFWSLFDQTASTLVFQAVSMDRHLFGVELLPSQIQAANPILILILIPFFAFGVYPFVGRFVRVTPLRKMATGMFLMTAAFALVAVAQEKIDAGQAPHIAWQLAAYAVLTSAEIMISIVGLEFAYTQAPKHMKSMMMSLFLFSVFIGNGLTAVVNLFIQIDEPAKTQFAAAQAHLTSDWQESPQNIVLPGFDGATGTNDDLIARVSEGKLSRVEFPGQDSMKSLGSRIAQQAIDLGRPPTLDEVGDLGLDPWGQPIRYDILNSLSMRLTSPGADGIAKSPWDLTTLINLAEPSKPVAETSWSDRFRPAEPWLVRHGGVASTTDPAEPFSLTTRLGGGNKLEKAAYFWFFTALMGATALLFVPFAMLYRPRQPEA
ncbi:POT family proton-dependent oligopeptide transporter [Haloferula luteola]|uniref:POT family proton-dependent oligopeptide transporter n=1 Tax=Haloferula luteola TaxID=595692 RepID=A0A840V9X3_9BACT|nr:POT family MFS transporter [Haloferula luteola]MBB5350750.1 POT family proton-dependent oligopeptide transporter [Haloferula luteola]